MPAPKFVDDLADTLVDADRRYIYAQIAVG